MTEVSASARPKCAAVLAVRKREDEEDEHEKENR